MILLSIVLTVYQIH